MQRQQLAGCSHSYEAVRMSASADDRPSPPRPLADCFWPGGWIHRKPHSLPSVAA